jgi:hypothetical protein
VAKCRDTVDHARPAKFTHASLAVGQRIDHPQTGGMAECLEYGGSLVERHRRLVHFAFLRNVNPPN